MEDLNLAFTLRIRLFRDDLTNGIQINRTIIIRVYDDLGWDTAGRVKLTCEVKMEGKVIFPKGQLHCALHGTSDGIKARELVMSLVAMKPGDTDRDYFDGYTPAQLEWAEKFGELLSMEREFRYCDKNGDPKKE